MTANSDEANLYINMHVVIILLNCSRHVPHQCIINYVKYYNFTFLFEKVVSPTKNSINATRASACALVERRANFLSLPCSFNN